MVWVGHSTQSFQAASSASRDLQCLTRPDSHPGRTLWGERGASMEPKPAPNAGKPLDFDVTAPLKRGTDQLASSHSIPKTDNSALSLSGIRRSLLSYGPISIPSLSFPAGQSEPRSLNVPEWRRSATLFRIRDFRSPTPLSASCRLLAADSLVPAIPLLTFEL